MEELLKYTHENKRCVKKGCHFKERNRRVGASALEAYLKMSSIISSGNCWLLFIDRLCLKEKKEQR
jgi:hypothetical protein